jgi:hypothetical protein
VTIRTRLRDWFGAAVGTAGLLVALLVFLHYQQDSDPVEKLAFQHRRIDLVERMQLTLATAIEAEKSAVMAITDTESQTFAARARAATAAVDSQRTELAQLLAKGGTPAESNLLAEFSTAFTELQRIDRELLDLAVQKTNLKAFALAFGPAAESIDAMAQALSRIQAREAGSSTSTSKRAMLLAATAEAGALRIQARLAPHIAEESDAKMDSLEAGIAVQDREVRTALEELARLEDRNAGSDSKAALASYEKFAALRTQIFQLSRQNTNVRSLAVSLHQKRVTAVRCQEALAALEQAIRDEPVSGRAPVNPREM